MRRQFIKVIDGMVVQDLEFDGPGATFAPVPDGMIEITGNDAWHGIGSLNGYAYDAQAQTFAAPTRHTRVISLETLLDRITIAEHTAFETLMSNNPQARAWWGQLVARRTIDLDAPRFVQGFTYLKTLAIPALWPDEATADARIAAIRADG